VLPIWRGPVAEWQRRDGEPSHILVQFQAGPPSATTRHSNPADPCASLPRGSAQDVQNGTRGCRYHQARRHPDGTDQDPHRPIPARGGACRRRGEAMLEQRFRSPERGRGLLDFCDRSRKLIVLKSRGGPDRGNGRSGRRMLTIRGPQKRLGARDLAQGFARAGQLGNGVPSPAPIRFIGWV
jgi:hypothetical protein